MSNVHKVGIINIKGGVGRTTISTNLGVRALENFGRVAILDIDPNAGSRTWYAKRSADGSGFSEYPMALDGVRRPEELPAAFRDIEEAVWDFVIVDGAPNAIMASEQVIRAVDVVIVPERCSDDDISATLKILTLCEDAGKPAIIVINEVPTTGLPFERATAEEIEAQIEARGVPVTKIHKRDAYLMARRSGAGVHELTGKAGNPTKARSEIDDVYGLAIVELLKKGKS